MKLYTRRTTSGKTEPEPPEKTPGPSGVIRVSGYVSRDRSGRRVRTEATETLSGLKSRDGGPTDRSTGLVKSSTPKFHFRRRGWGIRGTTVKGSVCLQSKGRYGSCRIEGVGWRPGHIPVPTPTDPEDHGERSKRTRGGCGSPPVSGSSHRPAPSSDHGPRTFTKTKRANQTRHQTKLNKHVGHFLLPRTQ